MKTASCSATIRPYVNAGTPARNPVACSFRKLMNPAASAMTSHFTDALAMSSPGQRVEASISAVGGLTAQLGAAEAGVGDVTEAVIKSPLRLFKGRRFFRRFRRRGRRCRGLFHSRHHVGTKRRRLFAAFDDPLHRAIDRQAND